MFYSEFYGPAQVSLAYSNSNPAREYLVQILHGEPRECCAGYFTNNQFTTRLPNGNSGTNVAVPAFQLGHASNEEGPLPVDIAVVTLRFAGLESFTNY